MLALSLWQACQQVITLIVFVPTCYKTSACQQVNCGQLYYYSNTSVVFNNLVEPSQQPGNKGIHLIDNFNGTKLSTMFLRVYTRVQHIPNEGSFNNFI